MKKFILTAILGFITFAANAIVTPSSQYIVWFDETEAATVAQAIGVSMTRVTDKKMIQLDRQGFIEASVRGFESRGYPVSRFQARAIVDITTGKYDIQNGILTQYLDPQASAQIFSV